MFAILTRRLLLLAALALAVGACATETHVLTSTTLGSEAMEFSFGEPGDPAAADRVIEITGTDDFRFDPAQIIVQPGETVTFRVINAGNQIHDFTLGDEATQIEHAEEMMGGMTMADEPNAITLAAGETKEITWRFIWAGTVLIGCHQPGHYEGGMKGSIMVHA